MKKKYPSKVSYFLLAILISLFLWVLSTLIPYSEISVAKALIFSFPLVVFAITIYMFLFTAYIIEGEQLKIKLGFITYETININQIKEVSKGKGIDSSPASSFDRIEIKYGMFNKILLSPKDKYGFVNDLIQINSEIVNKLTIE